MSSLIPRRLLRRQNGVGPGQSAPIGATVFGDGVNFSIYSRTATGIDLLLFDDVDDARPARVISLDRRRNRTHHYWHAFVAGVQPGQVYAYRCPRRLRPAQWPPF